MKCYRFAGKVFISGTGVSVHSSYMARYPFGGFLPASVLPYKHNKGIVHLHDLERDALGNEIPIWSQFLHHRVNVFAGVIGQKQQILVRILAAERSGSTRMAWSPSVVVQRSMVVP